VSDKKIAAYLSDLLDDAGIEVELAEEMQMVEALLPLMGMNTLDEVLESMASQMQEVVDMQNIVPPAVSGHKVTHQHLAEFAGAALAFYQAKPWVHVDSLFLIRIDDPRAPRRLKYATLILDERNEPGLTLFSSRKQYQAYYLGDDVEDWGATGDCWQMTFESQERIPKGDITAWQLYGWPLPHINAYPFVIRLDPTGIITRPPESVLVYMEGLLRVLAQADMELLTQEPCQMEVQTFLGPVNYSISMMDQTRQLDLYEPSRNPLRLADYQVEESDED
ncbi:MAG: hypothetical protein JKX85_09655, partial [Phycisphaeraceae bacterium]|nr:hypothetical protein [Phycisphaeraceae bacterium]